MKGFSCLRTKSLYPLLFNYFGFHWSPLGTRELTFKKIAQYVLAANVNQAVHEDCSLSLNCPGHL